MIGLILFTCITVFWHCSATVVKIDQGSVNGTELLSRNGTSYQAFYAIPYAAPPVGELRFKPPGEPPSWTGIRQAVAKGPRCIQNGYFTSRKGVEGSEDCLYLSVFTRELNPKEPVPVMVFIHGGAFCTGSGDLQDVHPLMDKPVVVVTLNYRLGILGLLSSANDVIPGNFALKDQAAALKWVQKNIGYFGGDPKSVTIFGQSSGSVSVNLHLMSPLSKGLFHRAIMESGTGRELWAYYNHHNNEKTYADTIKHTNCTSNSTLENLTCLQKIPAEDLVKIEKQIKTKEQLVLKYRPVIESANLSGAFLTGDPHTVLYQDPSIPIIIGFNSAEGILDTIPFLLSYSNMTVLDEKLDEILPQKLHYKFTTSLKKQKIITKMIKKFYFSDGKMGKGQEQNLCYIMSDYIFIMPIIEAAKKYPGPKYVYMYDYRNAISMAQMAFNICQEDVGIYGASHADELLDLFYSPGMSPKLSEVDIKFSEKLVSYWTNFASTGNPNTGDSVPKQWQASRAHPLQYLYMNNGGFSMKFDPLKKRHKFWLKCPLSHQYGTEINKTKI